MSEKQVLEQVQNFINKVKSDDWDCHVVRVKKNGTIEADNEFMLKPDDLYTIFEIPLSPPSFYYVLMKNEDGSGRVLAVVKDYPDNVTEKLVPAVIMDRDFDEALEQLRQLYENAMAKGDTDAIAYKILYEYLDALG